jgi:hypothetical protein
MSHRKESTGRICGCKWGLLKIKEGKYRWKSGSRETVLLFR